MLRGQDSNLRPPAYEAGELPTATTPRYYRLHYRLVYKPIKGLFYPFLLWYFCHIAHLGRVER